MRALVVITLAAGLAGCVMDAGPGPGPRLGREGAGWPETERLATALRPLQRPAAAEFRSMTVRSLVDGGEGSIAIAPYGNGVRIRQDDGCVSTRVLDWFAPTDSYAGCGASDDWHTARAQVRVLDPLYPLAPGSSGRYARRAVSHTGKVSARETRCEVTDAVAVRTPARGAVPAFVVACDDGRVERTTWYAPGIGPVAYREAHRSKGLREAWVRAD